VSASPLVSIVVPVFNGERHLRESLDSILAQTHPTCEVLVMDDASTDGTPAIVASYGHRVVSHRQPETRGIYGNVNVGIAQARGPYVAVYHADDVYDARIVEREVAFLEAHPGAGAVFCQDIFIDEVGREYGRLAIPPELRGGRPLDGRVVFNALLTYKNRFLRSPTSMVRAAVYREVGGYRDVEFRNTADLEMWLRIVQKYPLGILEEHLVRYRHSESSSASRYHRLRTDPERHFAIMDRHLQAWAAAIATPGALAAHEAHRAEDRLMCAISHYILDRRAEARRLLEGIRTVRIRRSPQVQRTRLLVLLVLLRVLVRLPRLAVVAGVFHRRWHARGRWVRASGARGRRGAAGSPGPEAER
jgi:GT2 family glycosyltransferase